MRKLLLLATTALIAASVSAQSVVDFEALPLPQSDTFYVNYNSPGTDVGFDVSSIHFSCIFDTSVYNGLVYEYWAGGFTYSNMTDSVTSGFTNQYAAKTAAGHNGSDKYAVFYQGYGFFPKITLTGVSAVKRAEGFYITNSTYAYNSMLNGDGISGPGKKFGGITGNDPDWCKVLIRGYLNGQLKNDSVEYYLADFRDVNNANDYIVGDWRWVDLSSLGNVDSVEFEIKSSDMGQFGLNTPAYFCMDDFTVLISLDVAAIPGSLSPEIYPNPATELIHVVPGVPVKRVLLMDAAGKLLRAFDNPERQLDIPVGTLQPGIYLLQMIDDSRKSTLRFIKQ